MSQLLSRRMRVMFRIIWTQMGQAEFGVVARVSSVFGIWPADKDDTSLRIRCSIVTFSLAVLVIQAMYDSYLNCVDLSNNADILYSVTYGIIGLSKMCFLYKYRDILRTNLESAVEDWSSDDSKHFSAIMNNCKSNYKKFMQSFLIFGAGINVMYMLKMFYVDPDVMITVKSWKYDQTGNVTTALKKRFLYYGVCTGYNVSPSVYWTMITFQMFQNVILYGLNLCPDGFLMAFTTHLCTQFEILKIKFSNCLEMQNVPETREKLSILVARHVHLLKLAKHLETAFSMIMFTQIVINLLVLNVAGFNCLVLLKRKEIHSTLTNAAIIMFALVQTFMFSYIGDQLTTQGDDIAQSVYSSEWYSMPTNISKDVFFVMTRTRFPIGLSAGSFFIMSRGTFMDMMKTAASYLSFVRILINDNIQF